MTPRELVELAKALTEHDNVRVLNVTLTVESDDDVKDFSYYTATTTYSDPSTSTKNYPSTTQKQYSNTSHNNSLKHYDNLRRRGFDSPRLHQMRIYGSVHLMGAFWIRPSRVSDVENW